MKKLIFILLLFACTKDDFHIDNIRIVSIKMIWYVFYDAHCQKNTDFSATFELTTTDLKGKNEKKKIVTKNETVKGDKTFFIGENAGLIIKDAVLCNYDMR